MNKFELGMRLIGYGNHNLKGTIVEFKKHNRGELHIIIEWENNDLMNSGCYDDSNHLVQYTESMIWECFSIGKIGIDKEYYRDLLIKNLLKK